MLLITLPAWVRILIENLTESETKIHKLQKGYTDFSYLIKARFLYAIAAVMLIVIIYDIVNKKIDIKALIKNKVLWAFSLYFLMVTLSSVFTEFKDIAFFGIYERYEGWLTIAGYLVVMLFAYLYINEKRMLKIAKVLSVVTLYIGIIGVLQYFSIDPFQWTIAKYLYLPSNFLKAMDSIRFDFQQGAAYSTLFNPNYVGSYSVLVLPVLAFYITKMKSRNWEIITALSIFFGVAVIFAAKSSAGILAFGFILFTSMLMMITYKGFKKWRKKIFIALAVLLVLGSIVFMDPIKEFASDIMSPITEAQRGENVDRIIEMQNNGKYFTFKFGNGNDLNIQLNNVNTPIFYDNDWNVLSTDYNEEKNIAFFYDEKYKSLAIKYFKGGVIGVAVLRGSRSLDRSNGYIFVKMRYLNSHVVNGFSEKIDYSAEIERFTPLDGFERVGTGRGYIWSRSIPLLKDRVILGSGPDSYVLEFPQNDIYGKTNYMIDPYVVVDKPHNMFLGIGINTGVISLLAFLAGVIMILIQTLKAMKKDDSLKFLFMGVLAYFITGMFNDSTVAIMPILYLFLGIMLSKIKVVKESKDF